MNQYPCVNCKKDSIGGGSKVYGGVFFKMCQECLEDEDVLRALNDYWSFLDEQEKELLEESEVDK